MPSDKEIIIRQAFEETLASEMNVEGWENYLKHTTNNPLIIRALELQDQKTRQEDVDLVWGMAKAAQAKQDKVGGRYSLGKAVALTQAANRLEELKKERTEGVSPLSKPHGEGESGGVHNRLGESDKREHISAKEVASPKTPLLNPAAANSYYCQYCERRIAECKGCGRNVVKNNYVCDEAFGHFHKRCHKEMEKPLGDKKSLKEVGEGGA